MSLPRPVSPLDPSPPHLTPAPLHSWCYLCVTFISCCMMYKKRLLTSSYAEYLRHFQTAWWLAAFNARTMLFEGCDSCYHSLVTYVRPCTHSERRSFIFTHTGKISVSGLCTFFILSHCYLFHLPAICNSMDVIVLWLWRKRVKITTSVRISWVFKLC